MTDEMLLRIEEVVRRTGLGRTTIAAEIASGRLQSLRVGKARRVPIRALDAWIADRLAEESANADVAQ